MVERGHCHTQATVAVARKLIQRTWTVLTRAQPYQYRDIDNTLITRAVAKHQARHDHLVPESSGPSPCPNRRDPPGQADPLTTPGRGPRPGPNAVACQRCQRCSARKTGTAPAGTVEDERP